MNKKIYKATILSVGILATLPFLALAQTNDSVEVRAITNTPPADESGTIRSKIRTDIENRMVNVRKNEDTRNVMLENRRQMATSTYSTSTRPIIKNPPERAGMRVYMTATPNRATTTVMVKEMLRVRQEKLQEMRHDLFEFTKKRIVKELNQAITNLKQIRDRVVSRISKAEGEGKDMTEAKAKLTIANDKITIAENALVSVNALNASSTTQTDAQASIDLTKPRQVANDAIKAIKDARSALNDVIIAIAKSLGLKLGTKTEASTDIQ